MSTNNDVFYVYIHRCPIIGSIRYIGKGSGGRAFVIKSNRHGHHKNWLNNLLTRGLSPKIEIVTGGLCESDAFDLEQFLISEVKGINDVIRFDLTNLTNGGDGIPGYTHLDETKAKQSVSAYKRSVTDNCAGVSFDKRCPKNPWGARITVSKGKRKYLGYFKTKEEAVNAYKNELKNVLLLKM